METIATISHHFVEKLQLVSPTAEFDVEIFLTQVLGLPRASLKAYPEKEISNADARVLKQMLARRLEGEPVAYIVGHQPFWTLDLTVSKETLIPRPETEVMVEWILEMMPTHKALQVADLGVGSGAIALSLAKERGLWQVDGVDVSQGALKVAAINQAKYHLDNVSLHHGVWCEALPHTSYDLIVSNPPYIAKEDPHLEALRFEPIGALVAEEDGLSDIKTIIQQARNYLNSEGVFVIEHGYDQAQRVQQLVRTYGFEEVTSHKDYGDNPRFVTGVWRRNESN